ncbi:hypothetical protein Poli38472_009408 [Pythium oligandrum]|uniref:Uncharacterized protein n=1 Tax=Pythium oligandrum TaxID=41045 RepID=A0A8K1CKE6_PYTOL|nr:hypothetical protein Poli38472_009408 [Pythium oligandrum]|eukprot:TMW65241.1 hypothetical protein Poli38472_009408 [Pythium oligandrum]
MSQRRLDSEASAATEQIANSCGVKVNANGCAEKRRCRDCLSASLAKEGLSGCYLDAMVGQCKSLNELNLTSAVTAQIQAAGSDQSAVWSILEDQRLYSSDNRKYCSTTDQACKVCEALANLPGYYPSTSQLKTITSDRKVCYGTNGCICASFCESDMWLQTAGDRCSKSNLPAFLTPSPQTDNLHAKFVTAITITLSVAAFLIISYVIYRRRKARRILDLNGPYHQPAFISESNRLQLPGWMEWQRQLRSGYKPVGNLDSLRRSRVDTATGSEGTSILPRSPSDSETSPPLANTAYSPPPAQAAPASPETEVHAHV